MTSTVEMNWCEIKTVEDHALFYFSFTDKNVSL